MKIFAKIFLSLLLVIASLNANGDEDVGKAFDLYMQNKYAQAFKLVEPLAKEGHAGAQLMLGSLYLEGDGVKKDIKEAVRLFKLSAQNGHNKMARATLFAIVTDKKYPIAVKNDIMKWYKKLATQGDLYSQLTLGEIYYNKKDYVKSFKWYKLRAKQGNAMAQRNIGNMYLIGRGTTKNAKKACKWFKLAAERDDTIAQAILGRLYYVGNGVKADKYKAYKWLKKAANKDNFLAQKALKILCRESPQICK